MIDKLSGISVTVSTEGTGGPYIAIPTEQLEVVRRILRRNRVPHAVAANIAGNQLQVVELGSSDVEQVQSLLDSIPGEHDSSDEICFAVRRCFPPTRRIIFDQGESSSNTNLDTVFVVARVVGDDLGAYDQPNLLKLINGQVVEDQPTIVLITGTFKNNRYELRLICE